MDSPMHKINSTDPKLSMSKLELQIPNSDKPEITNYEHPITNKFQYPNPPAADQKPIIWEFEFRSLWFVWYL